MLPLGKRHTRILVISGMKAFNDWLSYYYLPPYVSIGYQQDGGLLTADLVTTICHMHNCSLDTAKLYKGSVTLIRTLFILS